MSIGIDIGKHSIKIVELVKEKDQVIVKNIGIRNTFNDMDKFDLEKLSKSQISATIQDLCTQLKIKPKKVKNLTTSLSGKSIDVRQVTTLDMPDSELIVSLELEAKKHVPLDGTDAVIDFYHLGNNREKLDQIDVILATTTKNKIGDHAKVLKDIGFKPGAFDADSIAITNAYQYNHELPEEGSDVIINIGNSSSTLIVWGNNTNFFTRDITISGDSITREIMRTHSLNYNDAENKKMQDGINVFAGINNETSEETGIAIEQRTIYNDFIEEIRKTLRFYMKNNNNSFFNTFYLCGGSSLLPGIENFIAENLNVKVELLDPFKKIQNEHKINNPLQFSLAMGLALRGLDK